MNWFEPVWLYCERGSSADILAEPANALSTFSYLIAGLGSLWIYRKLPAAQQSADHLLLIALTFIVGLGSLAFHLFAAQWSELTHLLPLLLFVMIYLAFALNRFFNLSPGWNSLAVGFYVLAVIASMTMTCLFLDTALQPPWSINTGSLNADLKGATSCLNGSFAYFPALVSLFILAWLAGMRKHKAANSLLLAAFLLFVSLVFHSIDHLVCSSTVLAGHPMGVHFVWHVLSAAGLFVLLRSSMLYQNKRLVQEILPPEAKRSKNF